MSEFSERIELLQDVPCHWMNGHDVHLATKCKLSETVNINRAGEDLAYVNKPDDWSMEKNEAALNANEEGSVPHELGQSESDVLDDHKSASSLENQHLPTPDETVTVAPTDQKIKMAPPMRKCGRPKGQTLTVVGLPRKRKYVSTKRVPFKTLSMREKRKVILTWLVGQDAAKAAIQGKQLEEGDIEQRPEHVHSGIMDENVHVNAVQSFFFGGCLASSHRRGKI
ncbi:unnamed protein product [Ixodes pacificus]